MDEVDRIKWQKKDKQVQRESAEKEKRPKKKNKQAASGTQEQDPEKPEDQQTPPPTQEKRPLMGKLARKSGGLPPTPPEGEKDEGSPRGSPAPENPGGQNRNSGQQGSSNTSGPIKSPRGKSKGLLQIIYKGVIPFPPPTPFNPVTCKRRRRKDDDGTDGPTPAKKAKTDDPYHNTRIDAVDFKTWNTSWLMRLSQLKGLPTHPSPEAPTTAALYIQLIDQLEDREQEESVASSAYGGSTRASEPPIPLANSRGDIHFSVTADVGTATFNSLEEYIRRVLARRGIELAVGDLRVYASTCEPYDQGHKPRHLKVNTKERREAPLRRHLEGEWKTVYAWKYCKEQKAKEEEKRRKRREEKGKGQGGGDGKKN